MSAQPNESIWSGAAARRSVLWLIVLVIVTFAVGFVLLPMVHQDFKADGLWAAICRAAGVPANWGGPDNAPPAGHTTRVVLEQSMFKRVSSEAIGRGGSLAIQQCTMCHGAQGVTAANTPNLAGQYREVVVKELLDYKNGDRASAIMQGLALRLSAQDINDLAAYYASLPKVRRTPQPYREPAVPALVRVGDPLRNIAPCASCHGGIDRKPGTPWLEGMPKQYLLDQLQAFSSGTRRNDSYAQMRNMVRSMTPKEIDDVSDYYARHGEATAAR
jgi:cytochrome c553